MTPLREAALSLLPDEKGIFLRCDRGSSLYVSNAPARTDVKIDWGKAEFACRTEGKLAFLSPKNEWIEKFRSWLAPKVRARRLTDAVGNADFGDILEEDRSLFIEGVKRLEMKGDLRE